MDFRCLGPCRIFLSRTWSTPFPFWKINWEMAKIVGWKNSPDESVLDSSPKAATELLEKHLWGETTRHGKQGLIHSSVSPLFLSENFIFPWKSCKRAKAFRESLQFHRGSQTGVGAVNERKTFWFWRGRSQASEGLVDYRQVCNCQWVTPRLSWGSFVSQEIQEWGPSTLSGKQIILFLWSQDFICKTTTVIPGPLLLHEVVPLIKSETWGEKKEAKAVIEAFWDGENVIEIKHALRLSFPFEGGNTMPPQINETFKCSEPSGQNACGHVNWQPVFCKLQWWWREDQFQDVLLGFEVFA